MALLYVLFDLDETLYPREKAVLPAIDERIEIYLMNLLNITRCAAGDQRHYYNETYGTVLRGLIQEESIDVGAFLAEVHDVPVADMLQPNPELAKMLANIPLHRYIFTNSYKTHAENVMSALGVSEYFEGIYDIQFGNYVSKPNRLAYEAVISDLNVLPETCIYIDDASRNLKEPKSMGMKTILVDGEPDPWVDVTVDNVLEVGRVIQGFLNEEPSKTLHC